MTRPSWQPFSGAGRLRDLPFPTPKGSTALVFLEPSGAR